MKNKIIIEPGMEFKAVKRQAWKDAYIPKKLRKKIEVIFDKYGDPVVRKKKK